MIYDKVFNILYTLKEAQILIEQWRKHYNNIRPHSALNYRPPAPQAMQVNHLASVQRKEVNLLIH